MNFSTAKKSYKINFEMIKLTTETKKLPDLKIEEKKGSVKWEQLPVLYLLASHT